MVLEVNSDFALLYGIMLGDGCLSLYCNKKKCVCISGSRVDDVPFFDKVVKPIIKKLIDKDVPILYRNSDNSINLKFLSIFLFDFISSFGYPVGKKGNKLFIPKVFYEKNLVKYVLQGFFATDGSLVITDNNGTIYPRVEANGIAKDLIKEISDWINLQGIKCNLYLAKRKNIRPSDFRRNMEQFRIQINGKKELMKFIDKVGFVNPKQIERLNKYMAVPRVELGTPAL